jgi:hypothetical protein
LDRERKRAGYRIQLFVCKFRARLLEYLQSVGLLRVIRVIRAIRVVWVIWVLRVIKVIRVIRVVRAVWDVKVLGSWRLFGLSRFVEMR